ncbi:MAG: hypothetical protein LBG22_05330 [Treponema sp.]|jgi:hypothetical protein|nr:hypothetical protein [Treponema sp.]
MKYLIAAVLLLSALPVFPQDIIFPEAVMGMTKKEAAEAYPNLRFEKGHAWVSLGNAVVTRCYIDPKAGLYRVESGMIEEDDSFINALRDVFIQRHGGPAVSETEYFWNVDQGNTFNDPDTWLIDISQRNGFLIVGREFKNAFDVQQERERYYVIYEQGPAGGVVFYDKGHYLDGWRYLEAAPPETEFRAPWGWGQDGPFTNDEIESIPGGMGGGLQSAAIIVKKLTEAGKTGCAAQLCDALEYGGCDDWYLPAFAECYRMLELLQDYAPAGISKTDHWTSSLVPRHGPFYLLFARYAALSDTGFGSGISANKDEELSARAVRRF